MVDVSGQGRDRADGDRERAGAGVGRGGARCCAGDGGLPKGDALGGRADRRDHGGQAHPRPGAAVPPDRGQPGRGRPAGRRRRRRRSRATGRHRRPHRRRDGGADRRVGGRAHASSTWSRRSTAARSSSTSGSRPRTAGGAGRGGATRPTGQGASRARRARAVVTASNRAAAGVYADEGGPLIAERLAAWGFEVDGPRRRARRAGRSAPRCGRRSPPASTWSSPPAAPGSARPTRPRSRPRAVLDYEVPGLAEAIRAHGVAQGVPTAALSRGLVGRGRAHPGRQPARVDRRRPRRAGGARAGARARRRPAARRRPRERRRPVTRPRRCALTPGWPATLSHGRVGLRPISARDAPAWREIRARNREWLAPVGGDAAARLAASMPQSFRITARELRRQARAGRALPFVDHLRRPDGRAGDRVGRSPGARPGRRTSATGSTGRMAGRGITPTAVALVIDHCFSRRRAAPHRDRGAAGEHRQPAGGGQARAAAGGRGAALPAHRRRLARPPAVRRSPARRCPDGLLARVARVTPVTGLI